MEVCETHNGFLKSQYHKRILNLFYLKFISRGSVWHAGIGSIFYIPQLTNRAGKVMQYKTPGDSRYIMVYVSGTCFCCTVHS